MSEKNKKTESSNLKEDSDNQILIAALKGSATAIEAANNRIDSLDVSMISLVGEIKILVETSIRREESEIRNTERYDRQEKILIDVVEKVYFVEKQVLLLKVHYDNSKEEKEKKESNSDDRNNNIISALAVVAILAAFAAVYPYIPQ